MLPCRKPLTVMTVLILLWMGASNDHLYGNNPGGRITTPGSSLQEAVRVRSHLRVANSQESQLLGCLRAWGEVQIVVSEIEQEDIEYQLLTEQYQIRVFHNPRSETLKLQFVTLDDNGHTTRKLETANRWNRDRTFTRLYLDEEGDYVLQADFGLPTPQGTEPVEKVLSRFLKEVDEFLEYLDRRTPV